MPKREFGINMMKDSREMMDDEKLYRNYVENLSDHIGEVILKAH